MRRVYARLSELYAVNRAITISSRVTVNRSTRDIVFLLFFWWVLGVKVEIEFEYRSKIRTGEWYVVFCCCCFGILGVEVEMEFEYRSKIRMKRLEVAN